MSGQELGLALSVFVASLVECIEALTIVLAVGSTRSWTSALGGAGVAAAVLAALTAVLGPALTGLPLSTLRLVVGGLLLIFGLQWLQKAILRAAGLKSIRRLRRHRLASDAGVGRGTSARSVPDLSRSAIRRAVSHRHRRA
jgi:uncharacterized membrane protein